LAVAPEASLDAILAMTAALAAAAADEEEDKAAIRAEGTDKRFSDPKNPNEKKKNGAAIPPVRVFLRQVAGLVPVSSCAPSLRSERVQWLWVRRYANPDQASLPARSGFTRALEWHGLVSARTPAG
jgi:hypothetical protein